MNLQRLKCAFRTNNVVGPLYKLAHSIVTSIRIRYKKARTYYGITTKGVTVIGEVDKVLSDAGIVCFIDYGTMLSWYRENRFFSWEEDIDFGIIISKYETIKKVRDCLSGIGVFARSFEDEKGRPAEDTFLINGVRCDFCFYYPEEGGYRTSLFTPDFDGSGRSLVKILCKAITGRNLPVMISGVKAHYPENVESVICEKYGSNWRKPDQGWKYWKAPNAQIVDKAGKEVFNYL